MKPGLEVGATGQRDLQVGGSDVIYLGESQANGAIVFSTPSMINLMEHAARRALLPFLDPHEESVGRASRFDPAACPGPCRSESHPGRWSCDRF